MGVDFMSNNQVWGSWREGHTLRKQDLIDRLREDGLVSTPDGDGRFLAYVRSNNGCRQARVRLDDGRIRQYTLSKLAKR
jgi:hypothetical protein